MTFPVLQSSRLSLIEINSQHLDDLFEILSDPMVRRHIDATPNRNKIETMQKILNYDRLFIKSLGIQWGITFHNATELLGSIGYTKQSEKNVIKLRFALKQKHWNQGIMTEALECVMTYVAAKKGIHKVTAYVFSENLASQKVLLKNGFTPQDALPNELLLDNQVRTLLSFSLKTAQNAL
jgi:ribosomal-protein-alanine N-acetyltransferase